MYKNVELRKLPAETLRNVSSILDINEDWKRVMSLIPKDLSREDVPFEPKYNGEHMKLIENCAETTGRKCAEILFDEWSTSGRVRPTLEILQKIILQAGIYRAVDEISNIMCEPPIQRPSEGPAAEIPINLTNLLKEQSMEQRLNAMNSVNSSDFNVSNTADPAICNKTTTAIKSASDLIQFSKSYSDIAVNKEKSIISNKTTMQMKLVTDLMQFSSDKVPDFNIEAPTEESVNIPNLSVIRSAVSYNTDGNSLMNSVGQSNTSESISVNENSTQCLESMAYQTSFPDIDLETKSSQIDSAILHDANLTHFEYKTLEIITNYFSHTLHNTPNGPVGKIGSGGFGEVFVGYHSKYGNLAVKKAHNHLALDGKSDIPIKVFNAEVKNLSKFKHKNIVPILGYSKDGPTLCIVCEYVDGGSLEQKLAQKILDEIQRINILIGTAEGLKYLHSGDNTHKSLPSMESFSSKKNNFVHGDVKSANILLTKDCIPKLCDFGLAKQFETTFITVCPMGTSAYMAPEGFSGTVTQKIDIYSFGIVILEILTGLRPIVNNNNETMNIRDYIEENCIADDISSVLDKVVTRWYKATELYKLAKKCLEKQRKSRPSIDEIRDILCEIRDKI